MQIQQLTVVNFRNLAQVDLSPGPRLNLIWGENGQGKTNLLEALYLFAHFKSFRGARNEDLLGPLGPAARVRMQVATRGLAHQLELQVAPDSRSFTHNGKPPRPIESLLQVIRAVLFAPEELPLLRTQPAARRSLLDRAVFQTDPGFLRRAQEYERIVRQRNRLLKEGRPQSELLPWNEALIQSGAAVRSARATFIEQFGAAFHSTYRQLSQERETVALHYTAPATELAAQQRQLAAELEALAARERRVGQTLAGPHRDDLGFLLNGQPMRHFASQGQLRSLILSFKLAQVQLLRQVWGRTPLLLLDDMGAELDRQRQAQLLALLAESSAQVFMTTTDPHPVQQLHRPETVCFHMEAGRVADRDQSPHLFRGNRA